MLKLNLPFSCYSFAFFRWARLWMKAVTHGGGTTLVWSTAETWQIWQRERFVTDVTSDSGEKKMKEEKHSAAAAESALVWEKFRYDLRLSAVIGRISRVWSGDALKKVQGWHTDTDPGVFIKSQLLRGCKRAKHIKDDLNKLTDGVNPGKHHYLLWSYLIKNQLLRSTEHANFR